MESIIVALITGSASVLAVIITNIMSNRKIQTQLEINQAVTDTKITDLTREVREHNNFARRVPVLESQVENIYHRLDSVEQKVG